MAIGTTAAILGSAVISAGAGMLAGSKNSKAIGQATDAQSAATREATAAQREARNQNVAIQQPFVNTGNAAMGQINALLGLGGTAPQASGSGMTEEWANGALNSMGLGSRGDSVSTLNAHLAGKLEGQLSPAMMDQYQSYQASHPQGTVAANPQAANAAYDQFKNYTGYQTRLAEGNNALNAGYAAGGTLQSGDALKAYAKYNQNFASNEFGQYMNLLGGQQQLGAGAANALSGVNTNYANAASNLAIQNGQNLANSAVARANNTNGMIQGIGGAFSGALGQSSNNFGMGYGSSYRPG